MAKEIVSRSVFKGELEVDHLRGVIYFHCADEAACDKWHGVTLLRISGLPRPLPERAMDIAFKGMCDWRGDVQGE